MLSNNNEKKEVNSHNIPFRGGDDYQEGTKVPHHFDNMLFFKLGHWSRSIILSFIYYIHYIFCMSEIVY